MIELVAFNKSYSKNSKKEDSFRVKNVDLKIIPGKITALLGPNGSGKSTIMNAICGIIYPTSGSIFISDNMNPPVNISEHPEYAMKVTGFVPEISRLPLDITVLEFLIYCATVHGLNKNEKSSKQNFISEEQEAIKKVVHQFSLEKLLSKKIKTLSKGQQQRVSFAQALIHNPANLVLDEPVSGLDPTQIKQMRNLIKELSKTKSILMSTHILQEVNNLCSDVYIMNDGNISRVTNLSNLEEEYMKLTKNKNDDDLKQNDFLIEESSSNE